MCIFIVEESGDDDVVEEIGTTGRERVSVCSASAFCMLNAGVSDCA